MIQKRAYKLVCVDFGGTLFDFLSLHQRGFVEALCIRPGSVMANRIYLAVSKAVALGHDSFDILKMIREEVKIPNHNEEEVVAKKRELVELYLSAATLEPAVCSFLVAIIQSSSLAIISRGLVQSMEVLLQHSIGSSARLVEVFGRRTLSERVQKEDLLERAILLKAVQRKQTIYIGDAHVDQIVADKAGVDFLHINPFRRF